MKTILYPTLLTLLFSSISFARVEFNKNIKQAAVQRFITEANHTKTKIGSRISQINIDTTDGRNQTGTISLPVNTNSLQVVLLSNEKITNPWHYGTKNDRGDICNATDNNSDFIILLSSFTAVHMAKEFSTYLFKVNVFEKLMAKRKDGKKIEVCSEIFLDEAHKIYNVSPPKIIVGDINEVSIADISTDQQ